MIIVRDRSFSGYQPIIGTGYVANSQVGKFMDDGIGSGIDGLDRVAMAAGDTPVVKVVTGKWRRRILGYTRPIKRLRDLRRDNVGN
jgi:hypothetical protein